MTDPIARWHAYMRAPDAAVLAEMLDDEVVFQSPAVHTPQRGKAITMTYLTAAAEVLGNPTFRYVDEWRGDASAVLEFECELDGIHCNGVDIIAWNDTGRITSFKVMIRPMKALNTVVPRMAAALGGIVPKP